MLKINKNLFKKTCITEYYCKQYKAVFCDNAKRDFIQNAQYYFTFHLLIYITKRTRFKDIDVCNKFSGNFKIPTPQNNLFIFKTPIEYSNEIFEKTKKLHTRYETNISELKKTNQTNLLELKKTKQALLVIKKFNEFIYKEENKKYLIYQTNIETCIYTKESPYFILFKYNSNESLKVTSIKVIQLNFTKSLAIINEFEKEDVLETYDKKPIYHLIEFYIFCQQMLNYLVSSLFFININNPIEINLINFIHFDNFEDIINEFIYLYDSSYGFCFKEYKRKSIQWQQNIQTRYKILINQLINSKDVPYFLPYEEKFITFEQLEPNSIIYQDLLATKPNQKFIDDLESQTMQSSQNNYLNKYFKMQEVVTRKKNQLFYCEFSDNKLVEIQKQKYQKEQLETTLNLTSVPEQQKTNVLEEKSTGGLDTQDTGVLEIKGTRVLSIKSTDVLDKQEQGVLEIQSTSVLNKKGTDVLKTQGTDVLNKKGTDVLKTQGTDVLNIKGTDLLNIKGTDMLKTENKGMLETQDTDVLKTENTNLFETENTSELNKTTQKKFKNILNSLKKYNLASENQNIENEIQQETQKNQPSLKERLQNINLIKNQVEIDENEDNVESMEAFKETKKENQVKSNQTKKTKTDSLPTPDVNNLWEYTEENTSNLASKQNPVSRIMFRWSYYEGINEEQFMNHKHIISCFSLKIKIKKLAVQLERGEKTGVLHWQGCLQTEDRIRPKTLAIDLNKYMRGLTCLPMMSQWKRAEEYVTKNETRVKGPFRVPEKLPEL